MLIPPSTLAETAAAAADPIAGPTGPAEAAPAIGSPPPKPPTVRAARPGLARRMSGVVSSPVRDLLALIDRPEVISFAGGLPTPEMFDAEGLRSAFDRVLSGAAARRSLQYSSTEGDPALRDLIARRLCRRGLETGAADLLITTGSQQALTLLATALLDPGAVVLVEEPTYLAALQSFQLAGARVVAVAGDEDGIDPVALEETVVRERPALLYVVPTFANPTGRTLTPARRRAVAELAARYGFWIVEDDPYGELRYRGEPVAPLAAQPAAADRSVHLGSFSKIGAPGLRLGWLRAPADLLRTVAVVKQASDLHTSTVDQAAAAAYLAEVDLDAHVRRLCETYRPRRDAMLAALPETLPAGSTWSDPDGGMFVWVRLAGHPDRAGRAGHEERAMGVDAARLLPRAIEHDVAFVPGAPFYCGTPDRATLRLSFTAHTPERITEGMRRLAAIFTTP